MIVEQRAGRSVAMTSIVLVVASLLVSGCSAVRRVEIKTVTKTRFVKLGGAESVQADIAMGAGELRIDGKADELLKARFRYNKSLGEPNIEYDVRGDTGDLVIRPPRNKSLIRIPGTRNRWDLNLTDKVPIELSIDLGAGKTVLALSDLDLEELDLSGGVGDTTIDLNGDWDHDVDVSIDQGLGDLKVLLPKDFGVRIIVDLGLGNLERDGLKRDGGRYINDAYDNAKNIVDIEIDQGAGNIDLVVVD